VLADDSFATLVTEGEVYFQVRRILLFSVPVEVHEHLWGTRIERSALLDVRIELKFVFVELQS